jgi:hypothetical protein
MIQETNLVDDTHHAFDEIPQPSQMKLSISKSMVVKVIGVLTPNSNCILKEFCVFNTKSLKDFHDSVRLYQKEENVIDKMWDQKLELRKDIFWKYDWWVFKTRWKMKELKEVKSWLIFCDCNDVEKQLCGMKFFVLFKHRWRWKIIGGKYIFQA